MHIIRYNNLNIFLLVKNILINSVFVIITAIKYTYIDLYYIISFEKKNTSIVENILIPDKSITQEFARGKYFKECFSHTTMKK